MLIYIIEIHNYVYGMISLYRLVNNSKDIEESKFKNIAEKFKPNLFENLTLVNPKLLPVLLDIYY